MAMMPFTDSMFLIGESREHPLHIGALQVFDLPPDAEPSWLSALYRRLVSYPEVNPLFRRRPRRPVSRLGQWAWTDDDQLDLEYHVRLSALPAPGRVRELLELVSRLHSGLLDRQRPLWEMHFVEGLEGSRFALYTKVHHALLDSRTAMRLLPYGFSEDPEARDLPPPWAVSPATDKGPSVSEVFGAPSALTSTAWNGLWVAAQVLGDMAGLAPALVRVINDTLRSQEAMLPFTAPPSMLNVPITGARRFAAQSWPIERLRPVARAAGTTINDVVLAMCAGALRRYLIEQSALPEKPLVAAVPVGVRSGNSAGNAASGNAASGNPASGDATADDDAVGLILCNLATHLSQDDARLAEIAASMRRGKEFYRGLTRVQVTALSAIPIIPLVLFLLPAALRITPPPFNLIISSSPGPNAPLYLDGARLRGLYPMSMPYEGQALTIAVTRYDGAVQFGITGCRARVPHLQRLLPYLEETLTELERATSR